MKLPHVRSVDVVRNGIVVTYDDSSCAFYHESVLLLHLQDDTPAAANESTKLRPAPVRKGIDRPAGQPVARKLSPGLRSSSAGKA